MATKIPTHVLRALNSRGFQPRRSRGDKFVCEGDLRLTAGPVGVRMEVSDWDFLSYPTIKILNRPDFFPELLPHVTSNGDFCYQRPESVVLDRFNPAGAVLQCLDQARDVLEAVVRNTQARAQDIQDEFLAYWMNGQTAPWHVLIGTINENDKQAGFFSLLGDGRRASIIASSEKEAEKIGKAAGYTTIKPSTASCWILKSDIYPAAPSKLPETVKELFAYLKLWDAGVSTAVQNILERNKEYLKYQGIAFVVRTPIGWLGFTFKFVEHVRQGYLRRPVQYKQYLHGRGGNQAITRISIDDVSPAFVHSRNLLFPDLTDKRVTLIGCGAIGGYLAKALASLGAGRGRRGKLTLFDPGIFGAENVGRHYLGMNAIGRHKAIAVADDLCIQFPGIEIERYNAKIHLSQKLLLDDLVIDATGNEAVAQMLNAYRLADKSQKTPFLHVCVRGNGEAVQALWADSRKYGCFRCLRLPPGPRELEERFHLLKNPPKEGFKGCQAFTPYAVSGSMGAATLAVDMIIDWLKGDVSPRFRTRVIERGNTNKLKNQDIEPLDGCPACRPH